MAQRLNNLNSIIATLRSGATYYRRAARQTENDSHETMFLEHADLRETHAKTLADIIEEVGGEVRDTDPIEMGRDWFGRLFAMTGDTQRKLVSSLEEHEDRTLAVFRKVMHHPDSKRDEEILSSMFEDFKSSHDRMRDAKYQMQGRTERKSDTATRATADQPDFMKAGPADDGASQAEARPDAGETSRKAA